MADRLLLDDAAVEERLARLDEVLSQLEQIPGATAQLALEAVETLVEVYGEALARVASRAARAPAVLDALVADELLGHLLMLHDIHPESVEQRVDRALADVRPYIHSHGGEVELVGIDDGVARVRLGGSCQSCASSSATLELAVRDAVLAAAPELSDVQPVPVDKPATTTLISAESLLRKPAAVGDPGALVGQRRALA